MNSIPAPLPAEAADALRDWLGTNWTATPLTGDASVRMYYRVRRYAGETFVLAYYPPEVRPDLQRVMRAYRAVAKNTYVPRVIEANDFASLQQDVGDRTLFDLLVASPDEGGRWYRKAITLLAYFQQAGDVGVNAAFDAEFFGRELEMSREFFVEKLMGVAHERSLELNPLLQKLATNVSLHPYVLCHRDYHGQNIHWFNDNLYLLDYQDLRMGPDTYDLASLLRDRGIARILGDETELELIDYYAEWRSIGFPGKSPLPHGERRSIRRRYFETLLQRSIKILGTFAKQPITRGRLHYLDYIPATLESVGRCVRELPEYRALTTLLPMEFDAAAARERAERMFHDGETQNHAAAR
jgi:aminoglycoside/choline kinase family phosphotransferase